MYYFQVRQSIKHTIQMQSFIKSLQNGTIDREKIESCLFSMADLLLEMKVFSLEIRHPGILIP